MIDRHRSALVLVFAAGAILRGSLLVSPGFEADLDHFARWALAAVDPGLGEFGRSVGCNYMPAYLYVLGALGWFASAVGWGAEDEAFRLVLRLPANVLDLLFAILLYRFGHRWARGTAGGSHAVAGAHDAGAHDAGAHDAGTHDAETHDAGTHDAGTHDAGTHAAGTHDAGTHDAGAHAAGTHDAGTHAAGAHAAGARAAQHPYSIGIALFALYWANPALAYDASAWGQVDGLLVGLTTLSLVAAVERRHGLAGLLFGVALMFKLQAVVWAPVLLGYLAWDAMARPPRGPGVLRFLLGCTGAIVVLNIPFVFAGNALYAFGVAFESVGWHALVSLGALNLWWLVLGDPGGTWDGFRWMLGPTYEQVGLLASAGVGLFLAAWAGLELRKHGHRLRSMRRERSGSVGTRLRSGSVDTRVRSSSVDTRVRSSSAVKRMRSGALAALFLALAFYLFPTQMHERYAVFALGPLTLLASMDRRWQPVWALWTVGALWAMAAALGHMHPGAAIVPADWVRLDASWPVAIAAVNLAVWVGVLLVLTRHWRRAWTWSLLVLPLVMGTWAARQQLERSGIPLSQIRPEASRQGWRNLHHDVSVTNGPLRVGGEVFETGLGTHAPSEIVYELAGAFTEMTGACGLDDAGARGNQVRFVVVTDGGVAFDSGAVRGPAPAIPFEIPLEGVRTLRLLVDPADDGQHFDHADWVAVRLYR